MSDEAIVFKSRYVMRRIITDDVDGDGVRVRTFNETDGEVTGSWEVRLESLSYALFTSCYSSPGHRDVIVTYNGDMVTRDHPVCQELIKDFGDKWWIK